jgi:anti-sigma B factor antagonist
MSAELQPQPTIPRPDTEESLTCVVLQRCDTALVCPIGSLDVATVPVLEQQLREVCEAGFRRLFVDLGGLRFIDSTGLRLALKWHHAAQQDGFEIGFAPGPPAVQRVFELTGTSEHVPFIRPDDARW